MTSTAPSERPSARFAGLDGLRAVAVGLVVVYHLFPPALLPGGFIGVDVFFVISGFLITSLLLREHDTTGRVGLGRFWLRRARRLLPALALVVLVCSALAWLIGGDVLVDVDRQALGAATFAYNWVSIAGGSGYFADAAPELFRNFWSLGVEEHRSVSRESFSGPWNRSGFGLVKKLLTSIRRMRSGWAGGLHPCGLVVDELAPRYLPPSKSQKRRFSLKNHI